MNRRENGNLNPFPTSTTTLSLWTKSLQPATSSSLFVHQLSTFQPQLFWSDCDRHASMLYQNLYLVLILFLSCSYPSVSIILIFCSFFVSQPLTNLIHYFFSTVCPNIPLYLIHYYFLYLDKYLVKSYSSIHAH